MCRAFPRVVAFLNTLPSSSHSQERTEALHCTERSGRMNVLRIFPIFFSVQLDGPPGQNDL